MAGEFHLNGLAGPTVGVVAAGTALTGADTTVSLFNMGRFNMQQCNIGANTTNKNFVIGTTGLQVPLDGANNVGCELGFGILADAAAPAAFKIGTSPAFMARVVMTIPDVSEMDVCCLGFRKAGAYPLTAVFTQESHLYDQVHYTNIGALNIAAGAIHSITRLNSGVGVNTDTTNAVTDGQKVALAVYVSAAGVVTFKKQVVAAGATCSITNDSSPTVNTNTLTFHSTDIVIPFLAFVGAEAGTTPPIIESLTVRYQ